MLATVGESSLFNAPRFTLGLLDLQSGIHFVTLAMGSLVGPGSFLLALDVLRGKKGGSKEAREISNLRINVKEANDCTCHWKTINPRFSDWGDVGAVPQLLPSLDTQWKET